MAIVPASFVGDEDSRSQVGHRVALFLRQPSFHRPIKQWARDFDVAPATVRSWLDGNNPQMKHFSMMVAKWGWPFLEFIFHPVLEDETPTLDERLNRMEAEMAALRQWAGEQEAAMQTDEAAQRAQDARADASGQSGWVRAGAVAGKTLCAVLIVGTLATVINVERNEVMRTARVPHIAPSVKRTRREA